MQIIINMVPAPSELPDFLLNSTETGPLYLGISDPDLDSTVAVNQALHRACAMLYLSMNARVRSLFDYYIGEEYSGSGGTFQSFIQLSVHDSVFPQYTVIDTFFTRFNEAIIRISPVSEDPLIDFSIGKSYKIIVDKFRMEYEWGGASEFEDQTEISIHNFDSIDTHNILTIFQYDHQFEVVSTTDGNERHFPTLRYNYVDLEKGKQQYFKYGLWVYFVNKMMEAIADESKRVNERVRKASEMYEQNTQINQGISSNILTYKIYDVNMREGKVDVTIDIEFIDLK
jgi:hypothetical protein